MGRGVKQELEDIRSSGLYRCTRLLSNSQGGYAECDGKRVMLLCSNNYLGLAEHSEIIAASREAACLGTSSGASRLVSGTMDLHERLERSVARFKGGESALLFNSGYSANTGIIQALVGRGDVIFSDRLNHASIIDGTLLSGARLIRYRHNDYRHLASLMEKHDGGRTLIITDALFSMDGDLAPLSELVDLKHRFNAMLMVDDAHGSGVLGKNGRGCADLFGVTEEVDILMGTFGKALGSFGAFAVVNSDLRELFINRARSFIFSTSLPPAVLAASLKALEIVQSEEGEALRRRLSINCQLFREGLMSAGFSIPSGSTQIVPLLTGSPEVAMKFSAALLEAGYFAQGIRPPTVPAGTSRLRFTLMSVHEPSDLLAAVERISAIGRYMGVI